MRNNRPFLREPPYRRRETLIERLGFLFVQISSRHQSGGGQRSSVGDGCLRVRDSLCQRETPREYSTSEFRLRVPLAWSRERLEGRHPYYCTSIYSVLYSYSIRVYTLSNHSSVLLLYSSSIHTLIIGYILSEYILLNYSLRS